MSQPEKPGLLVLASTYPRWPGDPEPGFVHELAKRLTGAFDVRVLCPHAPGAPREGEMDGVHVRRFRYAPAALETLVNDGGITTNLRRHRWKWTLVPGFLLALAIGSVRELRRGRADVIHAHWLLPQGLIASLLVALWRVAPPFIVTSHGADLFGLRSKPLQAMKRFVARRAASVTVVSEAMRQEMARLGVALPPTAVQPMGVDLAVRFTPNPAIARSSDEILFVGRLVEKKGLKHLIDAMPAIVARRPSAFLTVAGFGPEESERRAQVTQLGLQDAVRFVGAVRQSELPQMFQRAAVFAAPFVEAASGDREGLGLVLVEAAGCGCPIVCTDLPATRQVCVTGVPGHRVPPGDPAALAEAILGALDERAAHLLPLAELRAAFDWETRARAYEKMLLAAIGDR